MKVVLEQIGSKIQGHTLNPEGKKVGCRIEMPPEILDNPCLVELHYELVLRSLLRKTLLSSTTFEAVEVQQ